MHASGVVLGTLSARTKYIEHIKCLIACVMASYDHLSCTGCSARMKVLDFSIFVVRFLSFFPGLFETDFLAFLNC